MGSLWKVLKGQTLLNGEGFVEEFKGLLKGKEEITQMPKTKKYAAMPLLRELFGKDRLNDKWSKDEAILRAYDYDGRSLREIAEYWGFIILP